MFMVLLVVVFDDAKVLVDICVDIIQRLSWEIHCYVLISVCIDVWIQVKRYLDALMTIHT